MKAQFADLPSGLSVPIEMIRGQTLSPAINAQAPDITVNSASLRNIANGFAGMPRHGAQIDVPEGARQVTLVLSDTMANVVSGSLCALADMLDERQRVSAEPVAKIEVVQ